MKAQGKTWIGHRSCGRAAQVSNVERTLKDADAGLEILDVESLCGKFEIAAFAGSVAFVSF